MPKDRQGDLKQSLVELAHARIKPKDLLSRVRERHPKASKKELTHAAFAAMIDIADQDCEKARALQDFGLAERNGSAAR